MISRVRGEINNTSVLVMLDLRIKLLSFMGDDFAVLGRTVRTALEKVGVARNNFERSQKKILMFGSRAYDPGFSYSSLS